jgi:hypothetical protein
MIAFQVAAEEVEMAQSGFLTTAEAARRLNTSTRNITRWIDRGGFPGAFKLNPDAPNSPFLIPERDIVAFEERRQRGEIENG